MTANINGFDKIRKNSDELAENIDKISDWIYQRSDFDHSILVRIFNQLLGVMSEASEITSNIPEAKKYFEIFRDNFSELTAAFENSYLILTADILHYEFVEGLLKWD